MKVSELHEADSTHAQLQLQNQLSPLSEMCNNCFSVEGFCVCCHSGHLVLREVTLAGSSAERHEAVCGRPDDLSILSDWSIRRPSRSGSPRGAREGSDGEGNIPH